jgi:hypothetical protein
MMFQLQLLLGAGSLNLVLANLILVPFTLTSAYTLYQLAGRKDIRMIGVSCEQNVGLHCT